jgi:hypothetical protein
MRRRYRQRLMLLLGVAMLLGWALWQHGQDLRAAPGTLLALDPDTVSQVELRLQQGPAEHYVKRDGHWWRTDGHRVRADDGRLAELAAIAQAPVVAWRPVTDFDPARIGLSPPLAVLQLDGHRLAFGETSVTGPQRYVRVGNRIARVSVRYTPRPATDDATRLR